MKTLIAFVVLALLGGGFYFYTVTKAPTPSTNVVVEETPTPTPTATTTVTTSTSTAPSASTTPPTGEVKEFSFTNSGMVFSPKTFSINKGDRVRITYKNGGGTHDFRIDGYNVGTKVLTAGQSETFEFVADKEGSFEYYCSVGNHRAMGMKGELTIQ